MIAKHEPAGVHWDESRHGNRPVRRRAAARTTENVWRCVQRGLVYPSPLRHVHHFFPAGTSGIGDDQGAAGTNPLRRPARHPPQLPGRPYDRDTGRGFRLWHEMSIADGTPLPRGMHCATTTTSRCCGRRSFTTPGTAFLDSEADLWFHVKSNNEEHCEGVMKWLRHRLEETGVLGRRGQDRLASGGHEVEPSR